VSDLSFVDLLAFGLVAQVGIAAAVVLGLAAFNVGSLLERVLYELMVLASHRRRGRTPAVPVLADIAGGQPSMTAALPPALPGLAPSDQEAVPVATAEGSTGESPAG
jgi:hypothetical protein